MSIIDKYDPRTVFGETDSSDVESPRILIAPNRYVQGQGVLDNLGRYLRVVPSRNPAILISARGKNELGSRLLKSLAQEGIDPTFVIFNGECSALEIERIVTLLNSKVAIDSLVAVGGGKCVDAGKSVAHRLSIPSIICPSLASNDAPCSALSVLYTPEGVSEGAEFFPWSPAFVIIDTAIVAEAPARYLVSGMGDAMATWYEADTCFRNPKARTTIGARPTLAARSIGELCAKTLFEYGVSSVQSVTNSVCDEPLENVIEANTLLSGLGFESGGLAGAHAVAQSYTVIPHIQAHYLHGEMVAMGLLAQLTLENRESECEKVATFFAQVGLPVNLSQVGLKGDVEDSLDEIVEAALNSSIIGNEPMELNHSVLLDACLSAHNIGLKIAKQQGEEAFTALH